MSESDLDSELESASNDDEASEHIRLLQILKSNKKLQRMLLEDEVLMMAITKALNEYNVEKERKAQVPTTFDSPVKAGAQFEEELQTPDQEKNQISHINSTAMKRTREGSDIFSP